jgi:hypothetical protein
LNITSHPLARNREIRRRWSGNTVRRKPRHEPRTNQRFLGCQSGETRCCQPGDACLFSAFLLLLVVWVLNDAYRGVAATRMSSWAQGLIGGRTILLLLVSFWLVLS